MAYKIVFEKGAEIDIEDAMSYYRDNATTKVAKKFSNDVRNRVKAIRINPFFKIYNNDYRGVPLKNFPYIIFFRVDEKDKIVYINSIFEAHQNPNKRRLQ